MPLKEHKRIYNRCFLKLIGTEKNGFVLKLVIMNSVKNKNVVVDDEIEFAHYDNKMAESIARARSSIWEYAMCNDWDYFFTGTLDPKKYDRYDLDKFHKDFTDWIYNISRYKKYDKINFLIIPEKHKDGAWHIHGLLSGLHTSVLHQFKIGDRMSSDIARLVRQGRKIYNWKDYADKFGFCSLEPIKNRQAVAKYITKYITKDVSETVTDLFGRMYWNSRPLNRAQKIKEGFLLPDRNPLNLPDYKNIKSFQTDYCSITELPFSSELFEQLQDAIV